MYNLKDSILDYEQVQEKLKSIEEKSNGRIKKDLNSKKTNLGYGIPHYTVGNGNKHIVLVAGVHGNEIISVDFMLKAMEDIANNEGEFKDIDFNDVTLDILPINNPEGYIIATSAIRTRISRNMSDEEIEKISLEYYQKFRTDNVQAKEERQNSVPVNERSIKEHHQMFKEADYTCIPDKYSDIKNSVKALMNQNEFPEGSMIDWKANAEGVEPNKSWLMNPGIYNIQHNVEQYGYNNFNTMRNNVPGPMGTPALDVNNFVQATETKVIDDLLLEKTNAKEYCGFFSYHGTGGYLEYEPSFSFGEEILSDEDRYRFTGLGAILAENYTESTKANMTMPDGQVKEVSYGVIESDHLAYDEIIRALYPAQLLVELSKVWGGNPIAPYGNKEAYTTTIDCNKKALAGSIKLMSKMKEIIDGKIDFAYNEKKYDQQLRPNKYK